MGPSVPSKAHQGPGYRHPPAAQAQGADQHAAKFTDRGTTSPSAAFCDYPAKVTTRTDGKSDAFASAKGDVTR